MFRTDDFMAHVLNDEEIRNYRRQADDWQVKRKQLDRETQRRAERQFKDRCRRA